MSHLHLPRGKIVCKIDVVKQLDHDFHIEKSGASSNHIFCKCDLRSQDMDLICRLYSLVDYHNLIERALN